MFFGVEGILLGGGGGGGTVLRGGNPRVPPLYQTLYIYINGHQHLSPARGWFHNDPLPYVSGFPLVVNFC